MAKGQTQAATGASTDLINQAKGLAGPGGLMSTFQTSMGGQQANQGASWGSAFGGIQNAQTTGGYDPTQLATVRANESNLAGTGGFTSDQTNTLNRGGYDPSALANINQLAQSAATTGGYDPSTLSTINSGYGNLAQGGFTPAQENQYMEQATSGVGNTYNQLENQAKQASIKTGGAGNAAIQSQMARQLAQAQSSATLGAETSLQGLKTSNEVAGLGGLNSTQANVAAGKQAGLNTLATTAGSQASNTLQGMESIAAGKAGGVGAQAGTEANVAGGVSNANSMMSQLYNTSTGAVTALGQQVLSSLGLDFSTQAAAISSLTQLSKNPGMLQTVLGDLTGMGGAAAGAYGALYP
jgi:hypothetical protein